MTEFADEKNEQLEHMDGRKIQSIMIDDEGQESFIIIKTVNMIAKIRYEYIYDVDVSKVE